MFRQTNVVVLTLLCVFSLQTLPPTLTVASSSAMVAGSGAQVQEDEQNKSERDSKKKQSRKNKKRKIRFSDWHQLVDWMFSTEKWEPILDAFKTIYDSMFSNSDAIAPTMLN